MHSSNNLSIRCSIPLHLSISKFLHSSVQSAFYICPISVWSYLHPSVSRLLHRSIPIQSTSPSSSLSSFPSHQILFLTSLVWQWTAGTTEDTACICHLAPSNLLCDGSAFQLLLSADADVTLRSPFTLSLHVMCWFHTAAAGVCVYVCVCVCVCVNDCGHSVTHTHSLFC